MKSCFTIVIFSAYIKSVPKYPKLSIRNIVWPSVTKQSNDNGRRIVEVIYKTYTEKANTSNALRIVCINAVDTRGEIVNETSAISILKYIKLCISESTNKSPINVIILPQFLLHTGKDAHEVMRLLWYIREHVVVISSSSLHATLPSTEVIAVGGSTEYHKAQGSVTDIVVTNSGTDDDNLANKAFLYDEDQEWLNEDSVQSLGPAVVSAIVLHILCCLEVIDTSIKGFEFEMRIKE